MTAASACASLNGVSFRSSLIGRDWRVGMTLRHEQLQTSPPVCRLVEGGSCESSQKTFRIGPPLPMVAYPQLRVLLPSINGYLSARGSYRRLLTKRLERKESAAVIHATASGNKGLCLRLLFLPARAGSSRSWGVALQRAEDVIRTGWRRLELIVDGARRAVSNIWIVPLPTTPVTRYAPK